ncbi:DNA replication and repair protein RecF [Bifidobacterium sp. ESL0790]|uniref:DNA replication/repair protein RecF n=1 Tax=Bifidobacterium sp. ESL0790 TaxID=2983233 RepID=UPI0023F7C6A1|nr:DNA replication and repair protein RecF [Bifidobacterium sp. ESL0790]WEV72425.1 DNA replication and repair protein RecF [Bifidobacterium sp. ESL0790]
MFISRLVLDHFRSWGHVVVDFTPGINILKGANGLGKTNIVEAVEVLSTGSSHRVSSSLPLIERGERKATIRANVVEGDGAGANADPRDEVAKVASESGVVSADMDDMRFGHDRGNEIDGAVNGDLAKTGDDYSRENEVDDGAVDNAIAVDAMQDAGNEAISSAGNVGNSPDSARNEPIADAEPQDPQRPTTYEVTIAARGANRGRVNGGSSLYMRDIVGRVSSVSFTPEDQRLVSGDPATRRGFLDQAGALFSPDYALHLSNSTKIARQRVALLKQLQQREETPDQQQAALSGLEVWTGQFIAEGVALTRARAELVKRLAGPFAKIYNQLAGGNQDVGLEYGPSFEEVLEFERPEPEISKHFQRLYAGEVARGRNLIGPHRDDLTFMLEGMPAREFASNGEMWTLALALKMALFGQIAEVRGVKPIVILDDVFAQLDENRRRQILDFALGQDQVLVTVASGSDIPAEAARLGEVNIIDVARLKTQNEDANAALVAQLQVARGPHGHENGDSKRSEQGHDLDASHKMDDLIDLNASHTTDESGSNGLDNTGGATGVNRPDAISEQSMPSENQSQRHIARNNPKPDDADETQHLNDADAHDADDGNETERRNDVVDVQDADDSADRHEPGDDGEAA